MTNTNRTNGYKPVSKPRRKLPDARRRVLDDTIMLMLMRHGRMQYGDCQALATHFGVTRQAVNQRVQLVRRELSDRGIRTKGADRRKAGTIRKLILASRADARAARQAAILAQ